MTMDWTKHIAFLLLFCISCGASAITFTFSNRCKYTVWPGILSSAGIPLLGNGGFVLKSGESTRITAPAAWSGRFWGRTGCNFSSDAVGSCESGDCAKKLECAGTGADPPSTLAEITLKTGNSTLDFYDVSFVDGFNMPVQVSPSNGSCHVAGCGSNINKECPKELKVTNTAGEVVACKSACLAFGTAQYCCNGAYGNSNTCKPTPYSQLFKKLCPNAYSYAFDDQSSLFTCQRADYVITFCPSANSGWKMKQKRWWWWWVVVALVLTVSLEMSGISVT